MILKSYKNICTQRNFQRILRCILPFSNSNSKFSTFHSRMTSDKPRQRWRIVKLEIWKWFGGGGAVERRRWGWDRCAVKSSTRSPIPAERRIAGKFIWENVYRGNNRSCNRCESKHKFYLFIDRLARRKRN